MSTQNNTLPSQSNGEVINDLNQWINRYRGIFDILLDAYCIVDAQHKVVEFNAAFTDLCGESSRKISKIGDFSSLIHIQATSEEYPTQQVLVSGNPVRLDELQGSTKAYPSLQMILAAVPIFSDAQAVLGCLVTIRNVSAENELQKKYEERKKDSVTDGLTKLFNKKYTQETLQKLVKGALRETEPLTVVMSDIDHFKKVNDTYGHQAGDYVLALVAEIMKEESRETDVVGRFGGEEFTAILTNTDQAGTLIFTERFRKRIESTEFMFQGTRIPVTISLGTFTLHQAWETGMEVEQICKDMIGKADTALYQAKKGGRNQTCQFETLPPSEELKAA